jgi:hypothetical protein
MGGAPPARGARCRRGGSLPEPFLVVFTIASRGWSWDQPSSGSRPRRAR